MWLTSKAIAPIEAKGQIGLRRLTEIGSKMGATEAVKKTADEPSLLAQSPFELQSIWDTACRKQMCGQLSLPVTSASCTHTRPARRWMDLAFACKAVLHRRFTTAQYETAQLDLESSSVLPQLLRALGLKTE